MRDFRIQCFENLIAAIVAKRFGVVANKIEMNEDYPLIIFEVHATKNADHHTYKGYLGCVGDLVVTDIDGKKLDDRLYVKLT